MSVFTASQPILAAHPVLGPGVTNPVPYRSGLITGAQHVVDAPSSAVLATMAAVRKQRSPAQPRISGGRAPTGGSTGSGFASHLASIGDGPGQRGLYRPLIAAVGAWMLAHGPSSDPAPLEKALRDAVAAANFDAAKHPPSYIQSKLDDIPNMIDGIARLEAQRLSSVRAQQPKRVTAPSQLPAATADEVVGEVAARIGRFVRAIPWLLRMRNADWSRAATSNGSALYGAETTAWRRRAGISVSPGVGKSEALIREIVSLTSDSPDIRIAYVVPEHNLAADIARRFDQLRGHRVASVWRGLTQPDPADPAAKMCRRHEEAELVQRAGVDLGSLCGSPARSGPVCPHHPDAGGACAYLRQRQSASQVWVVPAAMITNPIPAPLKRRVERLEKDGEHFEARPPSFDLTVLDEAPFLSFLGGFGDDERNVPFDWLDPRHWQPKDRDDEEPGAARSALHEVLDAVRLTLAAWFQLDDPKAVFSTIELTAENLKSAIRLIWRCAGERPSIDPSVTLDHLKAALSPNLDRLRRIRGLELVLRAIAELADGKGTRASLRKVDVDGVRHVGVFWKRQIDPEWLDCPVLYLDATAQQSVAECWLGQMTSWFDARANAPHMRVVQVHDRQFGYRSLIVRGDDDEEIKATARGNQQRIAEVLPVAKAAAGGAGLLIGPKAMLRQMANVSLIPAGWATANFGALRGVDTFGAAPVAVVVSRTLPAPPEVEQMAAVAFGRDVGTVGDGWYGVRMGARLMKDGTGTEAEIVQHQDSAVEAVRWLCCEAEVQQAIGRVRGVRRTGKNPVLVLVRSDVALGEVAVDELVGWNDLLSRCGPVAQMVARGVVPKLYSDIVAATAPRWSGSTDAENALSQWLAENPDAKAELEAIWRDGEARLPWRDDPIPMRPSEVGKRGRLRRKVWLAPWMDEDGARRLLG